MIQDAPAGALDDPEGWYREGGGVWGGVQNWEHMYTGGKFMLIVAKPIQYCKVKKIIIINKFF